MIKRQEALVDAMEKHLMPQEKLLEELRRINQQYEEISQETILNFISMYAHKEEYELGDIIYTEETMGPKELLEQDCVISLSKMKTHALERITGAVKNSYGFVYGFHKAKGHTQYPSADSFARMLIDLNKCVAA